MVAAGAVFIHNNIVRRFWGRSIILNNMFGRYWGRYYNTTTMFVAAGAVILLKK